MAVESPTVAAQSRLDIYSLRLGSGISEREEDYAMGTLTVTNTAVVFQCTVFWMSSLSGPILHKSSIFR